MGAREDLLAIPDEVLRRGQIGAALLMFMDFKDAPRRWLTGFGDVEAGGHRWQGVGDLISMSEISTAYDLSAAPMTFSVAAAPEMFALAINAKDQVRDRKVTVSLQLIAVEGQEGSLDRGQPIGSPMVLFAG